MDMRTYSGMILALSLLGCGEADNTDTNTDTDVPVSECENDVCILSGTITEDLTLTADYAWLLRGGVFIGDDVSETILTIEPGTKIYGESATDGMLAIRRNSKLMAMGTADAPIIMTSSKAPGSRARGDWGGLIINGNAPINACADDSADTLCEAFGEGGTGWFGGNNPDDSSGVLNYLRVEFGGTLVSPDNELNGIAFQGVGAGTEVDYVQVHMSADDGVEFFGGTVDIGHLVVTGVGDDSLDWTDGWQGSAQYVVLHQHDDNGDNGIEADNNAENNDAAPRSNPTLANVTIIGSPNSDASDIGMQIREGTATTILNTAVIGFNDACLDIDHDATWAQTDNGALTLNSVHLACGANFKDDDDNVVNDIEGWFDSLAGNAVNSFTLADPYTLTAPDYTATFTSTPTVATPTDSRIDAVDFVGAIQDGDDWTAGWTTHELN